MALENRYVSSEGISLESFDTIGDWTVGGTGASISSDTIHYKEGVQGLKLTSSGTNHPFATKTVNINLSSSTNFIFWIYVYDLTKFNGCRIYLSETTNFSKYFSIYIPVTGQVSGWNKIVIDKNNFINDGGADWSNNIVRLRVRFDSLNSTSITFDGLKYNYTASPKVIITFDDPSSTVYDNAYPVLSSNNQKAAWFVSSSTVGVGSNVTLLELQNLYSDGWDISNHTKSHINLTTLTYAEIEEEVNDCYYWLISNGFIKSANLFAYPFGAFNDTAISVLKQHHVLARQAAGNPSYYPHIPISDDLNFKIQCLYVTNVMTTASVKTKIDTIINTNGLMVLLFHQIVNSDADITDKYLVSDLQDISDYLKSKQNLGLLEVISMSKYYENYFKVIIRNATLKDCQI
jgi:peptidoglycan/xylan/chitin deacetylase (PgdA/CDA1 family)